ncbi:MAG: M56 family metallopeptidase [Verrucomicrobiota bacterium]
MSTQTTLDPILIHLLRGTLLISACWVTWLALQFALPRSRSVGYTFWRGVIVIMLGMTLVQTGPAWRFVTVELFSTQPETPVVADQSTLLHLQRFRPASAEASLPSKPSRRSEIPLGPTLIRAFGWIWLAGLVLGGSRLVIAHWQILKIRRKAIRLKAPDLLEDIRSGCSRLHIRQSVDLLEHPGIKVPFATGILRPAIIIPSAMRTWPESERRMALLHELAHVRGFDTLFQALASILGIVHWLNPLVWISWKRFALDRELHADATVLATRVSPTDYASLLVRLASRYRADLPMELSSVSMARTSSVPGRVNAILSGKLNRKNVWAPVLWICMGLLAGIALTLGVTTLVNRNQPLDQELLVKVYEVHPGFGGEERPKSGAKNVRELLESKYGVPQLDESTAVFNPGTRQLIVRNTQANHELLETVLQSIAETENLQIYTAARFLTISNEALKNVALPADALIDNAIFEDPQAQVALRRLQQQGAVVLATPAIITKSGQTGRIEMDNVALQVRAIADPQDSEIEMSIGVSVDADSWQRSITLPDFGSVLFVRKQPDDQTLMVLLTGNIFEPETTASEPTGARFHAQEKAKEILSYATFTR